MISAEPQNQKNVMSEPFFTVVIPTYNRQEFLRRAIDSVLKQTYEDFEIIVIDDNSTDDTPLVVNTFQDKRIRYMRNNRTKGAAGARNVGIFAAKGKWVAFLDDDDVWLSNKLKFQHKKIQQAEPDIGMICSDYAIHKGDGQCPIIIKNRPSGWIRDKLLYGYSMGCLSSVCIRSDILLEINGFDERFPSSQDWDLWLRTAEICQVTFVPKTLVHMHQEKIRQDRIGQNTKAKIEGHILLREKYAYLIDESIRLRHRHESLKLTYAILEKNNRIILQSLPWFLMGIFIDTINFIRVARSIVIFNLRKKQ